MVARRAILLSCGSFNPPTFAHLRMMEVAREHLASLPSPYTVVEGIYSPVSSSYVHKPLADDEHRFAMLEKATSSSGWLRADDWEAKRGEWTRTREVLSHHRSVARRKWRDDGLACFLVCGGDLVDSFARLLPDGSRLWAEEDVAAIVEDYGIVVITRDGSKPADTLTSFGLSSERYFTVSDIACPNGLSSTLLRSALADGRSIRYCTPDGVVDYILEHGLYGSKAPTNHVAYSPVHNSEKAEHSRSLENGDSAPHSAASPP